MVQHSDHRMDDFMADDRKEGKNFRARFDTEEEFVFIVAVDLQKSLEYAIWKVIQSFWNLQTEFEAESLMSNTFHYVYKLRIPKLDPQKVVGAAENP